MLAGNLPAQRNSVLRAERERVGLSLSQLAAISGLAKSTVSRIENGVSSAPRPQHLQRLARALDIDVEKLYVDAGYSAPGSLPELGPYLRRKYGLPDQAARQIEEYVDALRDRWTQEQGEPHDPQSGDRTT